MQKSIPLTNIKFWTALFVLAGALFVSYSIIQVRAQTNEPSDEDIKASGITFPIPELGNCGSKDECKSYCNDSSHMDVCISFAKAHGLMNKDEADRAEKFRSDLQGGAGPGGCTNPRDCQTFCSDIKNIEVCVKFAERHGVKDEHVGQARKLLDYIKAGGQTPGGCTSEASCRQYCSDFSHAEECFNFAKNAGITQVRSEVPGRAEGRFEGGIPPGQFQKLLELIKNGETPGGCKSKDDCEAYCKDQSHMEACIAFGEKVGFMSHDEALMIRKSGGKGPGNCNSRESCEAYCNDQAHQEECFKFAEEHGFVEHEDIQRAKEGFVRLRSGLDQAPPEIAECLKSTVGTNVLDKIQSGELTPGPEIGQSVRDCFEKFGHRSNPTEVFKNAPPEVLSCLKEKLGDGFVKVQSGEAMPTPEMGDTFRVCFQSVQLQHGFSAQGGPASGWQGEQRDEGERGPGVFGGAPPSEAFRHFLQTAPPDIAPCVKEQLGSDFDKIQSGENIQVDTAKLKTCFEQFRPTMHQGVESGMRQGLQDGMRQGMDGGMQQGMEGGMQQGIQGSMDTACLKQVLGEEGIQSLRSGMPPSPEVMAAMMKCKAAGSGSQGEPPLFNQKPYYQSVPSFSAPSGTYEKPPVFYESQPRPSFCAQVITPAKDPSTGYCKPFPTPCDVPPNWIKVSSCESTGTLPPPTQTICPAMPTVDSCPAGQVKKVMYSSPECGTYYGCVSETTSPPPPPGGNLLQIFRPLLFFAR